MRARVALGRVALGVRDGGECLSRGLNACENSARMLKIVCFERLIREFIKKKMHS